MTTNKQFMIFTMFLIALILYSGSVSAGTATDIWFTGGAISGGNNVITGTIIRPNSNINTITVGLFDNMDATAKCVIWNVSTSLASAVHMVNASVTSSGSNRSCVFDPGIQLNAGEYYFIGFGKNLVAGNQQQLNSPPSVTPGTNVNFSNTSSYYLNAGVVTSYAAQFWNIRSVTSKTVSTLVAPTFVAPTPADGAHNSTQVTINLSCSPGLNYYLYFANDSNPLSAVLSNSSSSYWVTNVTVEGHYQYKAGCYNWTANEISVNTTSRGWYYDTTFPTITLNPGNEFNSQNVTIGNAYDKVVRINLTLADNIGLFAYEINISKGGVSYFNITNLTLGSNPQIVYHLINASSWPDGDYQVSILVSDSHTANKIPDYEVSNKKSGISFKTEKGNNIRIETEQASTLSSSKKGDRYEFTANFDDKTTRDRLFHVKTDGCPLYAPVNSHYRGHLVSFCNGDGNWIDFEGVSGTPIVSRVDDHHYTVYFSNIQPLVSFKSIGGLNVKSANYSFYLGNYSFNNAFNLATEANELHLNLTKGGSIIDLSAVLNYNGVNQSVVETPDDYFESNFTSPNATGTYNFTWNVTAINSDGSKYTFNISSSQLIYLFGINNCSGVATNTTLQVNYYVESSPTVALSNSLDVTLSVWANDRTHALDYSASFPNATTHNLCIFPASATLHADVYLKYTSSPGFVERYYLVNHSFNVTPQILNLYNWNETGATSVLKLTTRALSDYSYYKNVIVTLQREYVGGGVWRNVQMDESGDFGLVNFNILERTTDYRLIFFDRSTERTLKTTQRLKFVCSSGLCDLTYLLNPNVSAVVSQEILYNFSYDNTTRNITVNWSDASGTTQTVRLWVWKNTITGIASICDVTQVGNSGSLVCDTTGYQGQVYVSLRQNGALVYGAWLDLAKSSLGSVISQAEGGLWTLGIMVIAISFGLFSPVGAIIAGVIGLIIVFFLGTFTVLTTTAIIIASIIGAVIGIRLKQ